VNAASLRDFAEYYLWIFFLPAAFDFSIIGRRILGCLLLIHKIHIKNQNRRDPRPTH